MNIGIIGMDMQRVPKIVLCILAVSFFASCVSTDYKLFENNKRVLSEAKAFIEENSHLLDILRCGEFAKYDSKMMNLPDKGSYSIVNGSSPHIIFFDSLNEEHSISLYSEELLEYLPQNEINTILYLRDLNLTEQSDLKYIFGEIYSYNKLYKIFVSIVIEDVFVYITDTPYKIRSKYNYIEQVGNYYIQVIVTKDHWSHPGNVWY